METAGEVLANDGDSTPTKEILASKWGIALEALNCEFCDWSYLSPEGYPNRLCPNCYNGELTPLNGDLSGLPYSNPPELVAPFNMTTGSLDGSIQAFASGIPFAPEDLNSTNLKSRLSRLYLPMWLVDADITAIWRAEAGFDYEVVSYQDRYDENRGGWISHKIKERRIRWEPRAGKLNRTYQNISAPALEESERIQEAVGKFDLSRANEFRSQVLESAFIRLPDRTTVDAWSEAEPAFQSRAAEECREASEADHLRQFSWQPEYRNSNWTLMLLPLYTSFYLDDERHPQPVFIHGQNGQINGSRQASMKRAKRAAAIIVGVAVLVFAISLLLSAASLITPPLLAIGVLGLIIALLVGAGAILPIATVWWFNRNKGS